MIHQRMTVIYTNWKGETRERVIEPVEGGLWWGTTEWHPLPQWFIKAIDVETDKVKDFALMGFKEWRFQ